MMKRKLFLVFFVVLWFCNLLFAGPSLGLRVSEKSFNELLLGLEDDSNLRFNLSIFRIPIVEPSSRDSKHDSIFLFLYDYEFNHIKNTGSQFFHLDSGIENMMDLGEWFEEESLNENFFEVESDFQIPSPGAIFLVSLGIFIVGWMRWSKTLFLKEG